MIISWAWKNRGAIYEKRKNVHCEKNDQSFTLKQEMAGKAKDTVSLTARYFLTIDAKD